MHTEHTTNCNVRSAYTVNGLGRDDVVWAPSPIGHSTGLNFGVRLALYFGLKLVLQDRWDADRAVELIETERCSYTLAATTFLTDLVAAAERSDRDVSSLTRFGCGGAPVPPEIVRAGAEAGINVLRIYGLTEALVVSWNRATSPLEKRMHTDGLALPEVELEIRDGEVLVRGPNVCVGLFDDPEREHAIFTDDGWLHTGDAGVLDDDGYLSIVGRTKEIIIRGGMNIAPREIEDVLCEMPAIQSVAVLGVPDERLGEITCACVVADDGLQLEDVVGFLRARGVATYKLPQMLLVVSELPTTPSGKIRKNELRELILRGVET
jgi:acyl-CoA synthetase (AMP-forming)/AMP-acid ligase II